MTEVTNLTVTEETLFNLTITDDSSTATTVSVPNEIATVALSLQDLNLELDLKPLPFFALKNPRYLNFLIVPEAIVKFVKS